jgi:4-hydroxyacetophenone monooxygenase
LSHTIDPFAAPITEDDAFIAAALEKASIPALMASIVHVTGDPSILRGPIRPGPAVIGELQGGLTKEDKARVRRLALEALVSWRDAGCPRPAAPEPGLVREMMRFVVGEEVPDDYVPMMMEEMALDGADARDTHLEEAIPADVREGFRVVVIGAGMSGLLMAIRLEEAGIPYVVIEKNDEVGGTWYENAYPGCRVDVPNHFYCYSFEPSHDWPEFFSRQPTLLAYFERVSRKYGVRDRIRFGTEVVAAHWDEADAVWRVTVRPKDGGEETLTANAVVSAVGQLSRPKIPDFEGRERFRGRAFHSARWERDLDLEGRRVAVIGTGASAFQLIPEVARQAGHTFVFQRSPQWMTPNPSYHRTVSPEKQWLLEHVPYYARWYRFLLFWPGSDGLMPSLVIDPDWPHPERSVNARNDAVRAFLTDYMKDQIGDDPELLEKVIPKYPPFVKRMLQDDGTWLRTLTRDDVELVSDGIERIDETGIVTVDGVHRDVDVIVYATGFHANRYLWPMEITGRGGLELAKHWGDEPEAYLGITVPRFPNLFLLFGPATNLAHAGSIIFHSECQVRYVMGCFQALLEGGWAAMDCKPSVHDAFNRRLQEALSQRVWSHEGTGSWYKNSKGRVTTTSPWLLRDYWSWTREPDLDDYELVPADDGSPV